MDAYFATKPASELAGEVRRRTEAQLQDVSNHALRQRWAKSWQFYYNRQFSNSLSNFTMGSMDLIPLGEQGELVGMSVNLYRNLIQHLLVLTTSNRPAMEVRATNSDSKSLVQARLGNNLLDYYLREKRLEHFLYTAVEQALVFGSGFVRVDWDVNAGREYGVQNGQVKNEGDLAFSNPSVYDVFFDNAKEDFSLNEYLTIRSYRNRFDLIAQYPEFADKLISVPAKDMFSKTNATSTIALQTDDVEVMEFFHKRTASLPNGRYMFFINEDLVFIDDDLPYRDIPIYRITPANILGTQFGYTPAFDMMGLQEAYNTSFSTELTNVNAFGVQNVAVPKGADINVTSLQGGLNIVEYNPEYGKPEALNLLSNSPQVENFRNAIEKAMEGLSGVNSVARGNPEPSLKSGTALALIQSMALQFASGLQNSYARLIEDVGTSMFRILRDYATTERVASLSGKSNRGALQSMQYTGEDLENIDRVVCDVGNPLTKTTSGRVQIAENLLQSGLLKNPQQYITVLTTGQLEPATEGATSQEELIRSENESLVDGMVPVRALITDNHVLHIQEHTCVINSPMARQDQPLIERTLAHIMEHINQLAMGDPRLFAVLGYPSMQQPPGPSEQAGPPGGPAPEGPPQAAIGAPQGPEPTPAKMPEPAQPPGRPYG